MEIEKTPPIELQEEEAIKKAAFAISRALTELLEASNASFLLDHVEGNWEDSDLDVFHSTALATKEKLLDDINRTLSWRNLTITFDRLYGEYRLAEVK